MRRILAAFDLSPLGRRVVERARLLAEERAAHLFLLHVLEPPDAPFLEADEERFLEDHRRASASAVVDWVAGRTSVPVEFDVAKGQAATIIARRALDAEVLVTGTSAIDSARCGPVTRRLARKARLPLLAVRRQPRVPYRRVVAAVDLSEASKPAVLLARQLAPEAELTAVTALSPRDELLLGQTRLFEEGQGARRSRRLRAAQDALDEFIAPFGDGIRTLVVEGPPGSTVGEAARRRGADLVTVANRGAGATPMVLLGGTAEEIMQSASSDVAIARVEGAFRRP